MPFSLCDPVQFQLSANGEGSLATRDERLPRCQTHYADVSTAGRAPRGEKKHISFLVSGGGA